MIQIISHGIFLTICAIIYFVDPGNAVTILTQQSIQQPSALQSTEITCKPDATDANVKEVLLIKLQRGNAEDVVTYRTGGKLEYGAGMQTHVEAIGHLEENVTNCYLKATINNPNQKDTTRYACIMEYIDYSGNLKQGADTSSLPPLERIMCEDERKAMRDEMSQMKQNMSAHIQEVSRIKQEMKEEMSQMKQEMSQNIQEMSLMKQDTTLVNNSLHDLITKDDLTCAFTAHSKSKLKLSRGKALVFPSIKMQHGLRGYNTRTGVFTAPVHGLYIFHLTMGLRCKACHMTIHLAGNDMFLFGYGNEPHQYSTSSVAILKKGQQVKPVLTDINPFVEHTLIQGDILHEHVWFIGYLIKAY